jgi:hypothetical protein
MLGLLQQLQNEKTNPLGIGGRPSARGSGRDVQHRKMTKQTHFILEDDDVS